MIYAKVMADSLNKFGDRLTTIVAEFPRFILAELNTHRVFTRNSASSRAVPFEKMVERVKNDPFIPLAWQKEHKGMQGTEYLNYENNNEVLVRNWLHARDYAIQFASRLSENGVTKQICNRLLEPFMWHTAIITASEWDNFYNLRCPQYMESPMGGLTYIHKSRKNIPNGELLTDEQLRVINKGQAEIHMMALAEAIYTSINESKPKELEDGEWHIPFGDQIDSERLYNSMENSAIKGIITLPITPNAAKVEIATARCARVSYINYEGKDDYESDFRLFKTLKDSKHMSPFEHCAKAMTNYERHYAYLRTENHSTSYGWCRNFRGFIQLRSIIE